MFCFGPWRWLIAPIAAEDAGVTRHYRGDTLILETVFETETGATCVIDFMARRNGASDVVRLVRGIRGKVSMRTELVVRFDYGSVVPWVSRQEDGRLQLTAGPDRLLLDTSVAVRGENFRTVGEFDVSAGEEVGFTLTWTPSFHPLPAALVVTDALAQVESFWSNWSAGLKAPAEWSGAVLRFC